MRKKYQRFRSNSQMIFINKNNKYRNLNYLPITMDIEPTTGCNFRCTMCQVSSPNFISKNLDYEMFKKTIDDNNIIWLIDTQFFPTSDYPN